MQRIRSLRGIVPRYDNNSVLKLIIILGVCYIMVRFAIVLLMVYGDIGLNAEPLVNNYIGIPPVSSFTGQWWSIITYAWVHYSFWQWLSNMVWLFVFGSSFQLLAGKQQIFPIFIFSTIVAGLFYLLIQLLPFAALHAAPVTILGAQAGIMGIAAALLILSPQFKFYLAEHFSVKMWVLILLYGVLMFISIGFAPLRLFWLIGGFCAGLTYGWLYKKGFDPAWQISNRLPAILKSNNEPRDLNSHLKGQQQIDALLEKVSLKGYASLSATEKEILRRESQNI